MIPSLLVKTPSPALEALIQSKIDKSIRRDMVYVFEEWDSMGGMDNFEGKVLSEIINRKLNLKIDFRLQKNALPNAWVNLPDIDRNSPVINGWRKYFLESTQGRMVTKWNEAERYAWINLETGVAGGFFTKLIADVTMTSACYSLMTPGERASLLCHEIGHYVIYLATLSTSMNTCFLLQDFVTRAMGNTEKESRVKLMTEYEKKFNVRFSNKEVIEESVSGDVIGVIVCNDLIEAQRNEFGSTLYDLRSFESLADNFVVRLDGGADLTSALAKIMPYSDPNSFRSTFLFYIMEIAKLIGYIMLATVSLVSVSIPLMITSIILLSQSPFEREYDKPAERIARIRRELIAQTKSAKISPERRVKLKEDIDFIDHIAADIQDRESFFEKFWLVISPYTREQKKLTTQLQALEEIVNNNLFVSSNNLKTLV